MKFNNGPIAACPYPGSSAAGVLALTYAVLIIIVVLGYPVDVGIQVITLGGAAALQLFAEFHNRRRLA